MTIADDIAAVIRDFGVDEKQAAELCGMHVTAYRYFIRKEAPPPHPMFCDVHYIAGLLETEPNDIRDRLLAERGKPEKKRGR